MSLSPMTLETRHLLLVREIADGGNMTAAAARLHLTQSALSHQLRDLEDALGTKLFLRERRQMVLTAEGQRILDTALRVLPDLHGAVEDVRGRDAAPSRAIRLRTQCHTGYEWLAPLFARFARQHPGVTLDLIADTDGTAATDVLDGRVDVAILTAPPKAHRRLRQTPLFRDEMVTIVPPRHRLAKKAWLTARDYESEHVIVYARPPRHNFLLRRVLEPAGVKPAQLSFVMLTEAMIALVESGVGIGTLPAWSAAHAVEAGRVHAISIGKSGESRHWTAVTLAAAPQHIAAFASTLRAELGGGPGVVKRLINSDRKILIAR